MLRLREAEAEAEAASYPCLMTFMNLGGLMWRAMTVLRWVLHAETAK